MTRNPIKSVWRLADLEESVYVPRCSYCGRFEDDLLEHWFFTGLYCVLCIRLKLYDDVLVPYYEGENYEGEFVRSFG